MTPLRQIEANRRKPSMPPNNKHRLCMTEADKKHDRAEPEEHEQPPPKFKLPTNCRVAASSLLARSSRKAGQSYSPDRDEQCRT
jgi:hypothetical protein